MKSELPKRVCTARRLPPLLLIYSINKVALAGSFLILLLEHSVDHFGGVARYRRHSALLGYEEVLPEHVYVVGIYQFLFDVGHPALSGELPMGRTRVNEGGRRVRMLVAEDDLRRLL